MIAPQSIRSAQTETITRGPGAGQWVPLEDAAGGGTWSRLGTRSYAVGSWLGVEFLPVPGTAVLLGVWPVRIRDWIAAGLRLPGSEVLL